MSVPKINYKKLSDEEKVEYINEYHWNQENSIYALSKAWGTYANEIYRDCNRLGIKYRTKSEAQKVALKTGASVHPTEGRERTDEEKEKIGDAKRESWKNLTDEEMEAIRKKRRKEFKGIKNDALRIKNFRKASVEGSKLEKFLYSKLKEEYMVDMHREFLLPNDKFHVDLYLPKLGLVIEVDGPSHYENIWGADNLLTTKEKDARKSGLIISRGFKLIRVINDKDFTESFGRDVHKHIVEYIDQFKKNAHKVKDITILKV